MTSHMSNLQNEFTKQNKYNKTAPFRDVEPEEIDRIIKNSIRRSERYRAMTAEGKAKKKF